MDIVIIRYFTGSLHLNLFRIHKNLLHLFLSFQSSLAALTDMVRISHDVMLPIIVPHVISRLSAADLFTITTYQYEVMLTPKGYLRNMKIIER